MLEGVMWSDMAHLCIIFVLVLVLIKVMHYLL